MEIIPAIYILNGRCVALYKSSYEQKAVYFKSPLEMARFFKMEGATKLHVVDLNGCRGNRFVQQDIVKKIVETVNIPVQLETGFTTVDEIEIAFKIGVDKVVIRPRAISLLKEAFIKYGAQKIIVEIQAKGAAVVMDGAVTAEAVDVVDFAERMALLGAQEVIYKDERSEGTLIHPNYDEVDRLFLLTGKQLRIYVSGGIATGKHLQLLKKIGVSGAIIGKAFYEKLLTVREAQAACE